MGSCEMKSLRVALESLNAVNQFTYISVLDFHIIRIDVYFFI